MKAFTAPEGPAAPYFYLQVHAFGFNVVFIIIILDLSSLMSGPVSLSVMVLPAKSIVSDTGMFVKRLVTS